jgi:hypothetical protein
MEEADIYALYEIPGDPDTHEETVVLTDNEFVEDPVILWDCV